MLMGFSRLLCIHKEKMSIKQSAILFLLLWLFPCSLGAQPIIVIEAESILGNRQEEKLTSRSVVSIESAFSESSFQCEAPFEGDYLLYAYVHHNWRNYSPKINVTAIDSEGNSHRGEHRGEHMWYLSPQMPGRWLFMNLGGGSYWHLPRGMLKVAFYAEGKVSAWSDEPVAFESPVSIASFFLLPLQGHGESQMSVHPLAVEGGRGDWRVYPYHPGYACSAIATDVKDIPFVVDLEVPFISQYSLFLSVHSVRDGALQVCIENESESYTQLLTVKASRRWQVLSTQTIDLKEGHYSVSFLNKNSHELVIDFMFLLPSVASQDQPYVDAGIF